MSNIPGYGVMLLPYDSRVFFRDHFPDGRVPPVVQAQKGGTFGMAGSRLCADPPMSFWWRWPTRRPGSSGACLAAVKHSGPKLGRPLGGRQSELYCEGDDDAMAKQGDRDRPNPRHCPSLELANVMGRRSSDSIRARGNDNVASGGRIEDCKPTLLLIIKTTCNQGASIDDNAVARHGFKQEGWNTTMERSGSLLFSTTMATICRKITTGKPAGRWLLSFRV